MRAMALPLVALLASPTLAMGQELVDEYVEIPGGAIRSAIRYEENAGNVDVPGFRLMKHAVSNAQFQAFVEANPQWRRDAAPSVFANPAYLEHWRDAAAPGHAGLPEQPVTRVSWYAADAYCKAQGARLPTWSEWEYAAAADTRQPDARANPVWRMRLFNDGTPRAVDAAAGAPPNFYGVAGLHGANWEWTEDFSSLLAAVDSRSQADGERMAFCGGTALVFNDREDYAMLKRFALLSALQPRDTLGNLGFRCARNMQ
jgi:formylglycine-generating enzyme required for sulfatase activity